MRLEKHVIQQYYKRLKYLVTMNTKVFIESYEAPQVEIIEVAVEKGFAGSYSSGVEQFDGVIDLD